MEAMSQNVGQASISPITPIEITEPQFNHLKCQPLNDTIPMMRATDSDGSFIVQNYFSGWVYRYDTRDITKLKQAGGFSPREKKLPDNPLKITEIITKPSAPFSFAYGFKLEGYVCSAPVIDNLVATTKSIDFVNEPDFQRKAESPSKYKFIPYKYMIDTKLYDIYGLDADSTLETLEIRHNSSGFYVAKAYKLWDWRYWDWNYDEFCFQASYEVCFEERLPFETIVGFFKHGDHTKFYPNPEYQGDFRWSNLGGAVPENS